MSLLLVVRDARCADRLARHLTPTGVRLQCVFSAQDALARLRTERPDAVVCELDLPDCDGLHLVRRIRTRTVTDGGTTPAIALISPATPFQATRALLAGYQASIALDAAPTELQLAIATLVVPGSLLEHDRSVVAATA